MCLMRALPHDSVYVCLRLPCAPSLSYTLSRAHFLSLARTRVHFLCFSLFLSIPVYVCLSLARFLSRTRSHVRAFSLSRARACALYLPFSHFSSLFFFLFSSLFFSPSFLSSSTGKGADFGATDLGAAAHTHTLSRMHARACALSLSLIRQVRRILVRHGS